MALFWRVFLAVSLWGGLAAAEELTLCLYEENTLVGRSAEGWHALLPEVVLGVDFREGSDRRGEQRREGDLMGPVAQDGAHHDEKFARFVVGLRWRRTQSSRGEVHHESRREHYCEMYWRLGGQEAETLEEAIGLRMERARFRALLTRGERQ